MLCAPVFIFISGSSALLGRPCCVLLIWLSLLALSNTLFWVYAIFSPQRNTKILEVHHCCTIQKWPPMVSMGPLNIMLCLSCRITPRHCGFLLENLCGRPIIAQQTITLPELSTWRIWRIIEELQLSSLRGTWPDTMYIHVFCVNIFLLYHLVKWASKWISG